MRCVLFDLDDTLFDHRHSVQSGLAAIRQDYASLQQQTLAQLHWEYLRLLNELHPLVLQGQLSLAEARVERLRRFFLLYGERVAEADLVAAAERYLHAYQAVRRPTPGAAPLLEALRATARIGVVTNSMVAEQRAKIAACGLAHLIDALVVSEAVGVAKPHPAIFQAALEQLGCAPKQAVMVGDSWPADIVGAHQAGVRPVWLNRYALPCPDPALATEITAFEPLDAVLPLLLAESTVPVSRAATGTGA